MARAIKELQDRRSTIQEWFFEFNKLARLGIAEIRRDMGQARAILMATRELQKSFIEPKVARLIVITQQHEKYKPGELYWQLLTMLEQKKSSGAVFSAEDLRFLYNVDEDDRWILPNEYIERVTALLAGRGLLADYSFIYGVAPHEVIQDISELNEQTKVYIGKREYNAITPPAFYYEVPAEVTEEELKRLSRIVNLPVSLTNLPRSTKTELTEWSGSIMDFSESFDYFNLNKVGRDIYSKADFTLMASQLEWLGGNLYSDAQRISLPNLRYANEIRGGRVESLDLSSLREARYVSGGKERMVSAPELEVIGSLYAAAAETLSAPKLKRAWNTISANNARKVDLSSLILANDIHLSRKNRATMELLLPDEMKQAITWLN